MRAYERFFDVVLSRVDPERAHTVSLGSLRALVAVPGGERLVRRICHAPDLPVRALGLEFPNPLGLAAGFY